MNSYCSSSVNENLKDMQKRDLTRYDAVQNHNWRQKVKTPIHLSFIALIWLWPQGLRPRPYFLGGSRDQYYVLEATSVILAVYFVVACCPLQSAFRVIRWVSVFAVIMLANGISNYSFQCYLWVSHNAVLRMFIGVILKLHCLSCRLSGLHVFNSNTHCAHITPKTCPTR